MRLEHDCQSGPSASLGCQHGSPVLAANFKNSYFDFRSQMGIGAVHDWSPPRIILNSNCLAGWLLRVRQFRCLVAIQRFFRYIDEIRF